MRKACVVAVLLMLAACETAAPDTLADASADAAVSDAVADTAWLTEGDPDRDALTPDDAEGSCAAEGGG